MFFHLSFFLLHFLSFALMFFIFLFFFLFHFFFSFVISFFLLIFLFVGGSKSDIFFGPQFRFDFSSHFFSKNQNFRPVSGGTPLRPLLLFFFFLFFFLLFLFLFLGSCSSSFFLIFFFFLIMIQLPRLEWRLLACQNGASPDCIVVVAVERLIFLKE